MMDTDDKVFSSTQGTETQNAISHVFEQKEKFIIVGLTGRIGSGCTTVANFLTKDFEALELPLPKPGNSNTNADREYAIVHHLHNQIIGAHLQKLASGM